jgi:hypothetical protein
MSGERRGRGRELKAVELFQADGFVSYRLAHGCADVVALKAGMPPMLVQVKGTRRPWERFGPHERVLLAAEAIKAGAVPQLCHWPIGARAPRFYGVHEWPQTSGLPLVHESDKRLLAGAA